MGLRDINPLIIVLRNPRRMVGQMDRRTHSYSGYYHRYSEERGMDGRMDVQTDTHQLMEAVERDVSQGMVGLLLG